MEMDLSFTFIAVIFALGFIGSFLSGISAVQVLFASIAGVWAYRKSGLLHNKDLIIYMGGMILIGSFIGSYGSGFLLEEVINIVYSILAIIAAVMMFIPRKTVENVSVITFNKVLASPLALIVGIGSGIVGQQEVFYSYRLC